MSSLVTNGAVLHALRVCGFADLERLEGHLGSSPEFDEVLRECEVTGLVRHRGGRVAGWSLTEDGRRRHDEEIAAELGEGTSRAAIEAGYTRFLDHNRDLKQVCTAWQLRPRPDGSTTINDHSDSGYDADVVALLHDHHHHCGAMFDDLVGGLERFAGYRRRLAEALERLSAGDRNAFARPMSASYHCVWMELHQDLLITLGRERDEADGH